MEPWAATKKALSYSQCGGDTSSCPRPYPTAACPEFHVGKIENFSPCPHIRNWWKIVFLHRERCKLLEEAKSQQWVVVPLMIKCSHIVSQPMTPSGSQVETNHLSRNQIKMTKINYFDLVAKPVYDMVLPRAGDWGLFNHEVWDYRQWKIKPARVAHGELQNH